MKANKHRGTDFYDFLRSEGILEEVEALAAQRIIALELAHFMEREHLSKTGLARRMGTTRSQVERLLDPANPSITLAALSKAAAAIGQHLRVTIGPSRAA